MHIQQKLETTLAQLVSIPSVTADSSTCHEILRLVQNTLQPYGLFMRSNFDLANPWLLATTKDTNEPDILLAAHLDVVAAPADMFIMRKHGKNFHGRGVFDMKFAAACYLELLEAHAPELSQLNIGFLFTTDEEVNSIGMADVIATGLRPKVFFVPDGGENWTIEKRAKGFYGIELVARGKSAHGSRPWEGHSALHTLLDALQPLREKYTYKDKHEATFMINSIKSGEAFNQIPDYASALVDFRCFDKEELAECRQLVAKLVKTRGLEVTVLHSGDTIEFNDKTPLVQDFMRALRRELNTDELQFCDSYGGTDARFFVPLGISCIVIQPTGGGRHSSEEWIKANDLTKFYRLIERWLLEEEHEAAQVSGADFRMHEKIAP